MELKMHYMRERVEAGDAAFVARRAQSELKILGSKLMSKRQVLCYFVFAHEKRSRNALNGLTLL